MTEKLSTNPGIANLKRGHDRTGVPNKMTKALKEMILGALDDVGGQEYLAKQALDNPNVFCALIGKVLPMQVNADLTSGGERLDLTINFVRNKNASNP
jgi:hypothetical protein